MKRFFISIAILVMVFLFLTQASSKDKSQPNVILIINANQGLTNSIKEVP